MSQPAVETWHIHARINHFQLDALDAESLTAAPQPKGRTVAAQFAHLHKANRSR